MASLIILIGLPGSGKSTYAQEYLKDHTENTVWCNSDQVRKELYGDENVQTDPQKVFRVLHNKVAEYLQRGFDVLYDATNVSRKNRKEIISIGKRYGASVEGRVIWAPYEVCVIRDARRERHVGEDVINKMIRRFQAPYFDEGFDRLGVTYTTDDSFDPYEYMMWLQFDMMIPHENPHHSLDVYDHCLKAHEISSKMSDDNALNYAVYWHDVGKPLTKFYKTNEDGTQTAHYYNHDNVGGWLCFGLPMLFRNELDRHLVSWMISNHMQPFFRSKYYLTLNEELKSYIDLLHYADKHAH